MNSLAAEPGVCRFCKCSDINPCYSIDTGETCAWLEDTNDTVCTSAPCVAQWNALLTGANDLPQRLPC